MNNLKWIPKDPDGLIGVPGKGYIKSSDFSQDDLDNLIERAKNRKIDVHSFLISAKLVPTQPQLELEIDSDQGPKNDEFVEKSDGLKDAQQRVRRTKAQIEADNKK